MRFLFVIVLLIILSVNLVAVTIEADSLRKFLYGEAPGCTYDNWVSHIAEGIARPNYNLYAPWENQTDGFGAYHIPEEIELLQWQQVYDQFLQQNLENAEALIDSFDFPYEVVEFTDLESSRTFLMLRENVDYQYFDDNLSPEEYDDEIGAFGWGWGLYLYNPDAEYPIIISAPHPNDDFITPPIALDCLLDWDAMFLFMSGAGREVEWTEVGLYNNGKSISDPTRNNEHPQIKALRLATDLIREDHRREFSAQIHSYDWNRHADRSNCQVSVVNYNPNLPTRDLSPMHYDLINQGDDIMISAGEYGNLMDCYLNDYYAVYYNLYPFYFYGEEDTLMVNNNIDLTGVGGAFLTYAIEDWNIYDVYDPFFHLEMDELPNQYPQTNDYYKPFYGYDSQNDLWNIDLRYDNVRGWYNRWVSDMGLILPDVLELNDGQETTSIETIWFEETTESSVLVNWDPQPCYDFKSYRIYYDTDPIDPETSPCIDRENTSILASPLAEELELNDLEINTEYYVMIATSDYNENISYSEESTIYTCPASIDDFAGIGIDDRSHLYWEADQQSGNMGFNVYRREYFSSEWLLHESWQNVPDLVSNGLNGQDYQYIDNDGNLYDTYLYRLSTENNAGVEFFFDDIVTVRMRPVYDLKFLHETVIDSISFGWNEYATDGHDEYFDLFSAPYQGEELFSRIYHSDWSINLYKRDIRANYQPFSDWKSWEIRVYTQYEEGEYIRVELSEDYSNYIDSYLENTSTGELLKLNDEFSDSIAVDVVGSAILNLLVGDVQPLVSLENQPNTIYHAGEEIVTYLNSQYPQLVDHISLNLFNNIDVITIIDSLSGMPDSLVWSATDDMYIHNAQLLINYYNSEGNNFASVSEYKIGIIPEEFTYNLSPGKYNISSIWTDDSFPVTEVFGADAQMYEYMPSGYQLSDSLVFGNGNWLVLTEQADFSHTGQFASTSFSKYLHPGWNLLPNPFPAPFEVQSLHFDYSLWSFGFRQLVEMGVLSPQIFAHRDNILSSVQEVNPGEAFYLYNFRDSTYTINTFFTPYRDHTGISQFNPSWLVRAELSQQSNYSEIYIGSVNNSSDEFDIFYDYPALPFFPEGLGCQIYLNVMDVTYPVSRFHTLFCEPLEDDEEKTFIFTAKGNAEEDLEINIDLSQLSLDYFAEMQMDSLYYDLDLGTNFSFEPDENGMIAGNLNVSYPRIWYYGDIDKEDGVEAFDAAIVLQYSVGIDPFCAPLPWQEWRFITADVDGSEEVDSYDAALILQYCIDMIDEFPAEGRINLEVPSAAIQLVAGRDNILQIISQGNLFSLDFSMPSIVNKSNIVNGEVLYADNNTDGEYKLSLASAHEIRAGTVIAELELNRMPREQEISLKLNGINVLSELVYEFIPQVNQLYPVTPNPFLYNSDRAPETAISFSLANAEQVKLAVYNIKGQKVTTLVDECLSAGNHEVRWRLDNHKGKSIASGVYFISLATPSFDAQRKFIILK